MDIQRDDKIHDIDVLERKAEKMISLIFSMCEEEIHKAPAMLKTRASSLIHAAMAAQYAIQTFLTLARIR